MNFMPMIEENTELSEIFQLQDPNEISKGRIKEMNCIINQIALEKKIQITKKSRMKLTRELLDKIKEADDQVTRATETLHPDDF